MPWVYNCGDQDDLEGWLWQEGEWHWGALLTWHVVDLDPDEDDHDFAWVCNLWLWEWGAHWGMRTWNIYRLPIEHIAVQPSAVQQWMVHPGPKHWWH